MYVEGAVFDLLIGSHLILGMTGRIIDTLVSVLARKVPYLCSLRMVI